MQERRGCSKNMPEKKNSIVNVKATRIKVPSTRTVAMAYYILSLTVND